MQELAGNPQPIHGSPHSSNAQIYGSNIPQECQQLQYTAPFVHNATNYIWTISGDNSGSCNWQIISGQGNRIVTIKIGKGFGVLTCRPQNSCGTGTMFYKNFDVLEADCNTQLRVSPNPNKGEAITISLKYPPNDPCNPDPTLPELVTRINNPKSLWIYDFYGNLIHESNDIEEVVVLDNLKLNSGLFLIKRMDKYGKIHTEKLIMK